MSQRKNTKQIKNYLGLHENEKTIYRNVLDIIKSLLKGVLYYSIKS